MRTVTPMQCAWNTIPLAVIRITDQFGQAWVEHSYPGLDMSEWEPLGRRSARFTVEAIFSGPLWEMAMRAFRYAVEDGVEGKFRHPYWGTRHGICQDLTVIHSDKKEDYAEVRFTFVEGPAVGFCFSTADTFATALAAALAEATAALAALAALP